MTRDEKIKWLQEATIEELIAQYENMVIWNNIDMLNKEHMENLQLARAEVMRRLRG